MGGLFFLFSIFSLILRSDDDVLRLETSQPFLLHCLCVSLFFLFVLPRAVQSSQCFAHRIQTPGSAKRNSHISQLDTSRLGRLARLVVALGAIRFAFTDRQRASAGPQSRNATPPSARAAQTPQIAVAELQHRQRFAKRRLKLVVRTGAGARGEVRLRQRLLLECSEPGVRLAGRPRSRATQHERHRRTADKRLLLPVIWLVAKRQRRAPPTASASGTHKWSQRFIAVLLVLVRQMRTRKVGLAARRRCHRASCRTLGTLAHYSDTHCSTCTCRAVRAPLFSFSTIEDVSPSQI